MKLALMIVIALFASASADTATYSIKATSYEAGWRDTPSCGATSRLMLDRWKLKVDADDNVFINGMRWKIDQAPWPSWGRYGDVRLIFKTNPRSFTYLVMDLMGSDRGMVGELILIGRLPDRRECVDAVILVGSRI